MACHVRVSSEKERLTVARPMAALPPADDNRLLGELHGGFIGLVACEFWGRCVGY